MDALQERVEVEAEVTGGDDDLAVDDATLGQGGAQRVEQLGEVAGERALVAAGQLEVVAVAEHDATEAVPLRLVQPTLALGDLVGQLGEHRRQRWLQWQ